MHITEALEHVIALASENVEDAMDEIYMGEREAALNRKLSIAIETVDGFLEELKELNKKDIITNNDLLSNWQREDKTIYQLGSKGTNRFWFTIQKAGEEAISDGEAENLAIVLKYFPLALERAGLLNFTRGFINEV